MVVDGGVTRQCTRGIGQEICSSAEIRSSSLVEHAHQQLKSIAGLFGIGVVGEGLVVMSTAWGCWNDAFAPHVRKLSLALSLGGQNSAAAFCWAQQLINWSFSSALV
jgi:hypothetical protein